MEKQNNYLNTVILILTLVTLAALSVSSTNVIIENVIAVYFWYLALTSMSLLLLLWAVMLVMLAVKLSIKWYERNHEHDSDHLSQWKWLHH